MTAQPPFVDTGYDPAARVYDLEYPECTGDELAFLASVAGSTPSRILELATGTGRVALALARLGHEVTGLDISAGMLARARGKRALLDPEIAARVTFTHGDMSRFQFDSQFDVVVAAFNALLLLPDAESRAACLAASYKHLRPGGTLVVDVFAANAIDRTPDHETVQFLEREPESNRLITRERFYTYDPQTDRGRSLLIYRLYSDDRQLAEELRLGYSLALLSRDQLVDEVRAAGFVELATYGDHRRGSWSPESPNLIVCARRRARS